MKTRILFSFLVAAISLFARASAQLIAYESFSDVALGSGISASGSDSFGWTAPWAGAGVTDSHLQIVDPTPDLSYQITGGALLTGGNRALLLTTNPEPLASTLFATRNFPNLNTTFYISFLMRLPISGTGSDSIDIHLMNGTTTVVRFAIRPFNPGPPAGHLWGFTGATGESGSANSLSGDNSKIHLIVIEARLAGSGNSYFINPFVNPGSTYPGLPGGTSKTGPFDRIGLSVRSTDTSGPTTTVLIDEIRIGYTWSDVVPPGPAPALVPDVTINQAVKLRWQSQSGKTYQVQYSYDLLNWFNFGATISGNNQVKEVFDSADADAKKFYRIQVP